MGGGAPGGRGCLWSLGVIRNVLGGQGDRSRKVRASLPGWFSSQPGEVFFRSRANLENLENKVSGSRQTTSRHCRRT